MKKVIYLTGDVSGDSAQAISAKFAAVRQRIEQENDNMTMVYHPVNQIWIDGLHSLGQNKILHARLQHMLLCEELYLLPGWQNCPMCEFERTVAMRIGLPITYL